MTGLIKKIKSKRQHGLFLLAVTHWFGRKGIRFFPYYLVREGGMAVDLPEFKDNIEEYTFDSMDPADLETLETTDDEFKGKKDSFQRRLDKGKKCFCAKHQGQIVAYTWFDFEECRFLDTLFKLKAHEAYLFDMYTLKSYRGKNIAPYLRYRSYGALRDMGKDTFFSYSEALNAPAVKFKKKLNAQFLGLYVMIDLFRRRKWNLKIKDCKS